MRTETVYPLRLSDELKQELKVIAAMDRRTLAWTIRDILQRYVHTTKSKTQNDDSREYIVDFKNISGSGRHITEGFTHISTPINTASDISENTHGS